MINIEQILADKSKHDDIVSLPLKPNGNGRSAFFSVFKCQMCGKCETRFGYVEFEKNEFEQIRTLLPKGGRGNFKKIEGRYRMPCPCKFYSKKRGCTIYDKRPSVCRRYPLMAPLSTSPNTLACHMACKPARDAIRAVYEIAGLYGDRP